MMFHCDKWMDQSQQWATSAKRCLLGGRRGSGLIYWTSGHPKLNKLHTGTVGLYCSLLKHAEHLYNNIFRTLTLLGYSKMEIILISIFCFNVNCQAFIIRLGYCLPYLILIGLNDSKMQETAVVQQPGLSVLWEEIELKANRRWTNLFKAN